MVRPLTLFTGQWADLPLAELAARAAAWGYDGLELACWGDHFDVAAALADPAYAKGRRELLEREGLGCFALGAHLVGQALCDSIEERHRRILPPEIWGDGDPEGVHRRAARVWRTPRVRRRLWRHPGERVRRVSDLASALLVPAQRLRAVEAGYVEVAERLQPVLEVFEREGVRFGLEVHPTEIAYDFVTTRKTLEALGGRESLGINLDPSHFIPQFLDPALFAREFARRSTTCT